MNSIGRAVNVGNMKHLSKKLTEARTAPKLTRGRPLSQEKLAKMAGLNQSSISKWEKDEEATPTDPSFLTVVQIARVTRTPLWWWATEEDVPVPSDDDYIAEESLLRLMRALSPVRVLNMVHEQIKLQCELIQSGEAKTSIDAEVVQNPAKSKYLKSVPVQHPPKARRPAARKKRKDPSAQAPVKKRGSEARKERKDQS